MDKELNDLVIKMENYTYNEKEMMKKAYIYAKNLHSGQFRQSGEPYIIHPIEVTNILLEMHADIDTLCAAMLHDTLEDTSMTKSDICQLFNGDVANLVDGVTKISKMNFSSKQAQNLANTRKIITSLTDDVRIIIIKLADRLHNMRTLMYKSKKKQEENSLETLEIFAPLAYYIGAYRIKAELEDLSLMYLKPYDYNKISDMKQNKEEESNSSLNEMLLTINDILNNKDIPNKIKLRTKNIYGLYKQLNNGQSRLADIHDFYSLKIMVDNVDNCYRTLGLIHSKYPPINDHFKDYICNPKTNMYQSLHTTVFGLEDRLVQNQIRTFEMDKVASFGLTAYWDIKGKDARFDMQKALKDKYQFFKSLLEINSMFSDNRQFVEQVKIELFANNVYVYTPKGEVIELPIGSTPIDFAYHIHTNIGNAMIGAIVNDKIVPLNYNLQNKDRVKIITSDKNHGPNKDWIEIANTTRAKRKIKEYQNNTGI